MMDSNIPNRAKRRAGVLPEYAIVSNKSNDFWLPDLFRSVQAGAHPLMSEISLS